MQTFARHRAWLAAPRAEIEVDLRRDLVLVTCYPALADLDVDPGPGFSAGFHGSPGDHLLTTLALTGTARWRRARDPQARTAAHLVGPVLTAAVGALVTSGGERTLWLSRRDGEELAARWNAFLID